MCTNSRIINSLSYLCLRKNLVMSLSMLQMRKSQANWESWSLQLVLNDVQGTYCISPHLIHPQTMYSVHEDCNNGV